MTRSLCMRLAVEGQGSALEPPEESIVFQPSRSRFLVHNGDPLSIANDHATSQLSSGVTTGSYGTWNQTISGLIRLIFTKIVENGQKIC